MSTSYKVAIVLDVVNKAKGQLATATKQVNSFVDANKQGLTSIRNAAGIAFGTISAGAGFAVKAYQKQARAEAQVRQGLKSTAEVAGRSMEQLMEQARMLQQTSIFGDEDILQKVTAQLLTFTSIATEQFDRTQQAAIDLATRFGGDLQGSAIQLGKALNDPIKNLSQLTRKGIGFTESQLAMIKSLSETGRLAEAQNIILGELETQFGGSAQAAAEVAGSLDQAKKEFGDMTEVIGGALMPALNEMADGLRPVIESISEWVSANPELVSSITKIALGVAGGVLALTSLALILPTVASGFALVMASAGPIVAVVAGIAAAKVALDFFVGSQERVIIAAGEVNAALENNITQLDTYTQALEVLNGKRANGIILTTEEAASLEAIDASMSKTVTSAIQLAHQLDGSGTAYEQLAKAQSSMAQAQQRVNEELKRYENVQAGGAKQLENAKNKMKIARFEVAKFELGLTDVTNMQDLMTQGLAKVQGSLGQLSTAKTQAEFDALQQEAIQALKALLAVQQGIIATSNTAGGSSFLSTKAIGAQKQIKELQGLYWGLQNATFSATKEVKSFGSTSSKAVKAVSTEVEDLAKKMEDNLSDAFDSIKTSGQEAYDALNTAVADSAVQIADYSKEINGINDQFTKLGKKAGEDAFDIGFGISATEQKTVDELGKRYAGLGKELEKLEAKRDSTAFTKNFDPKTLEDIKKIQGEIAFIQSQGAISAIEQAKAFEQLSKAEQIVAKSEAEITKAKEKQSLLRAIQAAPGSLDTIQTIQTEGGQTETFFKNAEGALVKIQDIENAQFAVKKLRQQEELAIELDAIKLKKQAEQMALVEIYATRAKLEHEFQSFLGLSTEGKETEMQRVADKQRELFGDSGGAPAQFVAPTALGAGDSLSGNITISIPGATFIIREEADIQKVAEALARETELGQLGVL